MDAATPVPVLVTLSRVELATVASRLGLRPWTPLVRRAIGPVDRGTVSAEACRAAAARLGVRGLLHVGSDPGTVDVHPGAAAAAGLLGRAELVVEAIAPGGARRALALLAGEGAVLVDDQPGEDLVLALVADAVPVAAAVATLLGDGSTVERLRVSVGDDDEVATVTRRDGRLLADLGATEVPCADEDDAGAVVAAHVRARAAGAVVGS